MIHALNCLLVYGLSRRLILSVWRPGADRRGIEWPALFISTCWALHPINLTAVLFVVQRMEILSHAFVFAGLWLYIVGRQRQLEGQSGFGQIATGILGFTFVGVMSKESAALLPVYALCLELCLFRFRGAAAGTNRRLVALYVIVLAIPAFLGAVWIFPRVFGPDAYASRGFTLAERLMTEPRVIADYLSWILLPNLQEMSFYHDDYRISRSLFDPPSTFFALAAIPVYLATAWWALKSRPLLALGMLWFLGAHLLTATVIPLELVFEHRNYFSSLGVCLAIADLFLLAPNSPRLRQFGALIAVTFALLCLGLTYLRALEWSDPVSFSRSEALKRPGSPRASYDWGRTLVVMGDYRKESPHTKAAFKALRNARSVPASGILPNHALLILAARTGQPIDQRWWDDTYEKLRASPIGPQERAAIAGLTRCANDGHCRFSPEAMMELFGAALMGDEDPEVMSIYADYVLHQFKDAELALRLWDEAIQMNPREGQYRINRAKLLIAMGRWAEAGVEINRLRKMGRRGQYEAEADSLDLRLDSARRAGNNAGHSGIQPPAAPVPLSR